LSLNYQPLYGVAFSRAIPLWAILCSRRRRRRW